MMGKSTSGLNRPTAAGLASPSDQAIVGSDSMESRWHTSLSTLAKAPASSDWTLARNLRTRCSPTVSRANPTTTPETHRPRTSFSMAVTQGKIVLDAVRSWPAVRSLVERDSDSWRSSGRTFKPENSAPSRGCDAFCGASDTGGATSPAAAMRADVMGAFGRPSSGTFIRAGLGATSGMSIASQAAGSRSATTGVSSMPQSASIVPSPCRGLMGSAKNTRESTRISTGETE